MTEKETTLPPIQDTLSKLYKFDLGDFNIYADSEEFFAQFESFDFFVAAYHETYIRYLSFIEGEERKTLDTLDVPKVNLILTSNKKIFKDFYHSPERFDNLPDWVKGYVNFKENVYVLFIDKPELEISPWDKDKLDGACHEFSHIMLPNILGIPPIHLEKVWGTWLNEAFAISLNQLRTDEWVKEELNKDEFEELSIAGIMKHGIFYFDKRKHKENIAYQYCAKIAAVFGRLIGEKELDFEGRELRPLDFIMISTALSYEKQFDFWEYIGKLGINIEDCEKIMRNNL